MERKQDNLHRIFGPIVWKFRKIEGDLSNVPEEFALAHCVAADFTMGAGITSQFRQRFGYVNELIRQNARVGEVGVLRKDSRYVFFLVIKRFSTQQSKYSDLLRCLIVLRAKMLEKRVRKLAFPKIGCSLDRLEWEQVYDMLYRVFSRENIEIVLYEFKS